MRIFFLLFLINLFISPSAFSTPISGGVEKQNYMENKLNKIIDSVTGLPIGNAEVSIPSKGLSVLTSPNGHFELSTEIKGPLILSVKANGYMPFSITVNENSFKSPLVLGISKQSINKLVVDSTLHHLGDNNFSESSANADEFKVESAGPRLTKKVFVKNILPNQRTFITIGSIIGVDTEMARRLKQNNIKYSCSTPTKVFVNDKQVGEIKINGDEQIIEFSPSILQQNSYNKIVIETGLNTSQTAYIDYDDIEIMNLILEIR